MTQTHNIILVPGFLGFDRLGGVEYFAGVAKHLEQAFAGRVSVREAKTLPFGSIEGRAGFLARQVDELFPEGELHVVAHSMGGLDARRLVAEKGWGFQKRVRSVVAVGTPHQGSPVATGLNLLNLLRLADSLLSSPLLDMLRDNFNAINDLSGPAAKTFNNTYPDVPGIKYLEIAGVGRAGDAPTSLLLRAVHEYVRSREGANDGVVSESSARRSGRECWSWQADHMDMIGHDLDRPTPGTRTTFPYLAKYEEIVRAILREDAEDGEEEGVKADALEPSRTLKAHSVPAKPHSPATKRAPAATKPHARPNKP